MKKIICLLWAAALGFALLGCASTNLGNNSVPAEYVEFSRNDVFYLSDFNRIVSTTDIRGLKITDSKVTLEMNDSSDCLRINDFYVDFADFKSKNPDLKERLEKSKRYTVYLSCKTNGNFFEESYTPVLEDIEGLRTVSEIQEEEKNEEIQRIAEEKAASEAKQKKDAELKLKSEKITQGYIYHGPDEAEKNAVLYKNEALEYGHAYFIESFMIKDDGELGGAALNLFSAIDYHYIQYANQSVRQEATSACESILGAVPVTIIVAGGKAPLHIPVVLGILK